ncbi:MAG: glycoside hydrolase family 5 protein [Ruminiclostridium sp.]|nr:glycoside hydrolase family 5 protein [Ruminiclostridium sp.]
MNIKKLIASFLAVTTIITMTACNGEPAESLPPETVKGSQSTVMREMTTMELVKDMGIGINLGNTLESCGNWINDMEGVAGYEKAWGSPIITEPMIKGYKEAGFGVLRVPVAWSNLMLEDYVINPDYIARTKQIVNWALDSGLYVIMNIHWDNGWFANFGVDEKRDEAFRKYEKIWTQLAEEFKNYSDYLMFESLNEEGGWESIWNRYSNQGDKEKSYGILNDINQRFVDIVRKSGGNNEKRHLLIAGYNTDIDLTCDELFKMPEDKINRMAVSVHYYTPSTFAILEKDADWGKAKTTWGNKKDVAELEKYMNMLKTTFYDKGVPVIIGEYGCAQKNKTAEMVNLYLTSVCKAAYERGLCPVLWDVTDAHYNREECKFIDNNLLEGLMAVKEAK